MKKNVENEVSRKSDLNSIIQQTASDVRATIENHPTREVCHIVSPIIAERLRNEGIQAEVMRGVYKDGGDVFLAPHFWVEAQGWLIDVCLDQLNKFGGKYPPIHIVERDRATAYMTWDDFFDWAEAEGRRQFTGLPRGTVAGKRHAISKVSSGTRQRSDDYLMPALDDHGGRAYLAYTDLSEARAAARFQKKEYGIACTPVRVCT